MLSQQGRASKLKTSLPAQSGLNRPTWRVSLFLDLFLDPGYLGAKERVGVGDFETIHGCEAWVSAGDKVSRFLTGEETGRVSGLEIASRLVDSLIELTSTVT